MNSWHQKYFPRIKRLYNIWYQIIERCYNENYKQYYDYGGRGVVMCDDWKNSYQLFLDWSLANGYASNLQIDKDIKGGGLLYSPQTCTWVVPSVNKREKRNSHRFFYEGKTRTLSEICEMANLPHRLIYERITKMNIPFDVAISTPIVKNRKKIVFQTKRSF